MSMTETGDMQAFARRIRAIAESELYVGIPAESERKLPEDGEDETNATIGYKQEFGGTYGTMHIPPRPFLSTGMFRANDVCAKYLATGFAAALEDGDASKAEAAFEEAGQHAVNTVRYVFTANNWPALSMQTINARIKKGRNGTRPLVDTGQLRNSITYVVMRGWL